MFRRSGRTSELERITHESPSALRSSQVVQGLARLSGAGDAFHFVATVQNLKLYDGAVAGLTGSPIERGIRRDDGYHNGGSSGGLLVEPRRPSG